MVQRDCLLSELNRALGRSRIVLLSGPRQSGKTTIARELVSLESVNYFDLENPLDFNRLSEPFTALNDLRGLVVIDEVQRSPDLFPVLRVLADRPDIPATFLILGSASGQLLRQSSESLAGRLEIQNITGFTLDEVGAEKHKQLWLRGSFPRSFLADSEEDSSAWRRNFMQTLLERDFPQWGVRVPATALGRFWRMLAHYHGQYWNAAEPARVLGVSQTTVRRHLDIMTDAFMIRQLQPWLANLAKRQVKSPKIYIRDSGLLHQLLGIETEKGALTNPKTGASWEGFVIEQVIASTWHDSVHFWASHQGAEIDLILTRGDDLFGVECKLSDAPKLTLSMKTTLDQLGLSRIAVIYPGMKRYQLYPGIEAVPVSSLEERESLFR